MSLRDFAGIAKAECLVGSLLVDLGNLANAREHLKQAVAGFNFAGDVASAARALNQVAYLHYVKGELRLAVHYNREAKEYAVNAGDNYYSVILSGSLAAYQLFDGQWRRAMEDLKTYLVETKKMGDFYNLTTGLILSGFAKKLSGSFKEAREAYLEAVRVSTKENLAGNLKVAYEFMVSLCIAEGRFAEAEDYLKKAMEIGERVSPYGTIMTQCWRLMGDLYNAKGEPLNALKAYETCESYLIKLPEELERGACFVGRGVAFAKLQQWKVSRDCFEKALDVFDQCENDWETAKAVVTAVEVGAYSAKQVTLQLVTARELFQKLEHPAWEQRVSKLLANSPEPLEPLPYFAKKENFEKQEILAALEKAGQNKTRAAELLGLPRQTLQHKIKKH
ncbi:MAG TPA: helix-turn-helix domain-containing protein, partial [Verrucomicrobiae bacterium]|nr:helix-turn-helix domain-containing protein [Verrucomicrobiae bacterium]